MTSTVCDAIFVRFGRIKCPRGLIVSAKKQNFLSLKVTTASSKVVSSLGTCSKCPSGDLTKRQCCRGRQAQNAI